MSPICIPLGRQTVSSHEGLPGCSVVRNPSANAGDMSLISGSGRSSGGVIRNPLVFLPGKFHRQRNMLGYSSCGLKESDTAE